MRLTRPGRSGRIIRTGSVWLPPKKHAMKNGFAILLLFSFCFAASAAETGLRTLGKPVPARLVRHDGAPFALVDAVPDRGEIVLVPGDSAK